MDNIIREEEIEREKLMSLFADEQIKLKELQQLKELIETQQKKDEEIYLNKNKVYDI